MTSHQHSPSEIETLRVVAQNQDDTGALAAVDAEEAAWLDDNMNPSADDILAMSNMIALNDRTVLRFKDGEWIVR